MSGRPLKLRVDAPYPGETLSSFLGRTAQYYMTPVPTLIEELMQGGAWRNWRRDVDLAPPATLEHRLAHSVKDWRSPLMDHVGFQNWTLAPNSRRTYCPLCFQDDLAAGRTPYFRMDWIAVLVTSCWRHETPLFVWEDCDSVGRRRLPQAWVCKAGSRDQATPAFMQMHLARLKRLREGEPRTADGLDLHEVLGWLRRVQDAIEKPFDAPLPAYSRVSTAEEDLRSYLRCIVEFAARYELRDREPPLAHAARPVLWSDWFGPLPDSARRRQWKFADGGFRRTGCVGWRRSYLFFAVRTLAGTGRFGRFITGGHKRSGDWAVWWNELRPKLGPEQRETLDWHEKVTMKNLNSVV